MSNVNDEKDPQEAGVQHQQDDQHKAEERDLEAADVRPAVEVSLSVGDRLAPGDVAVATGLATREEAPKLSTAGMTMPSVGLEQGVSPTGQRTDGRNEAAARFHRVVTGEEEADDDFEVMPGVTRRRMREASRGVAQEGHGEDLRRVVLSDTSTGPVTSTVTVEKVAAPAVEEAEEADEEAEDREDDSTDDANEE